MNYTYYNYLIALKDLSFQECTFKHFWFLGIYSQIYAFRFLARHLKNCLLKYSKLPQVQMHRKECKRQGPLNFHIKHFVAKL